MFTKKQESELITSIKGRGEVPLKFAYLGEGAKNWEKIASDRSSGEGINSTERILLEKKVKLFLDALPNTKSINIIDIGCGNAFPCFPILKELRKRKVSFDYIPVDISKELIDIAIRNVKKEFGAVSCKPLLLDFELGNFSDKIYELRKEGSTNLLLFLGSTLGNHSDRNRVLTNFRDSMSSDDFLLIGVELTNVSKVNKLLSHYTNRLAKNLVYFIPEKIGIKRIFTKSHASWNDKLSQVEIVAELTKDIQVKVGSEKFILEKDEQLLLGRSVKFNEWSITKLLSDVGFRTEVLTTTEDRGYILSLVQPTRYRI